MRGVWLVAGSLGLLVAAYAADLWLQEILFNVGAYGGSEGWQERELAVALLGRVVLLAGLATIFAAMRGRRARWARGANVAIGALVGVAPPLIVGVHIALLPDGLPFVYINTETSPLWSGMGVFLLWTAIGLVVTGLVAFAASRRKATGASVSPLLLVMGAALLFVVTYPLDALFQALAVDLALGPEAYPLFMLVGLVTRVAVMGAFAVLLAFATAGAISRLGAVALLSIGVVGFAVVPIASLFASPVEPPFVQTLASELAPGLAGRWMTATMVVVGGIALLRSRRQTTEATGPTLDPEATSAVAS